MPRGRPIRNNQPQGHLKRGPTVQTYAAQRLNLALDPNRRAPLDDETKLVIDSAALLQTSVTAYAPQHSERLRAILRDMLQSHIDVTTIF